MRFHAPLFAGAALLLSVAPVAVSAGAGAPMAAAASASRVSVPAVEQAATIAALKPPKRARPVVAVLAGPTGAEVTDFLIPHAVLARSQAAEVMAVAAKPGLVPLGPALALRLQETMADFDRKYPGGADYIIVPAVGRMDRALVDWVKAQADKGATIVGICAGGVVLAQAELLRDRAATGYWGIMHRLRQDSPTTRWVRDRRYVVDRGVVTTTGISASLPVSLALVEAIAGRPRAAALARELGAPDWTAAHDTAAFEVDGPDGQLAARVSVPPVAGTPFGVPVRDGVDDIALAFTADAYSRVHNAKVVTVADKPTVRTRDGLELVADRVGEKGDVARLLPPVRATRPAQALDAALADIAARHGADTADKIAHQLEYPRAGRGG
jgi:putative intracellular protease/amidase